MKIHPELQSWLEDRERRQATMERVAAVRHSFRNQPAAKALDRRLGLLTSAEPDAILQVARETLENPDWPKSAFSLLIRAARADPFFRPATRNASTEILSGLWLYESPLLSIFAAVVSVEALAGKRVFRTGRASVAFTGQRSIYRFIGAGGAVLSLWEAPEIGEEFTAEGSGRCRRTGRLTLADGDILELDGRRQGFVIDHAVRDICYLQAVTPAGAAALMAEYDVDRLDFVGASSTDEASSRTQLMLSLLRLMDRADAVPVFEQMLESPHFYARWQAMREFLGLDAERALPHLRRMAVLDPHPEVRAAARATLAALSANAAHLEEEEMCRA